METKQKFERFSDEEMDEMMTNPYREPINIENQLNKEQEELYTPEELAIMEASAKNSSKYVLIATGIGMVIFVLFIAWLMHSPAILNNAFSGYGAP